MLFQSKSSKLFAAIREGREDHVRDLLLPGGMNLSERDPQGRTALVLAAEQGRATVVKLLLTAGAEVNEPAATGETPLIAAASQGSAPVVELLLASGARVNDSDSSGATALHAATVRATRLASLGIADSVQKLLPLLDAGANVNSADKMGYTPLMASVRSGGGAIEETNRIPVLLTLLQRGAEVDHQSRNGRTALLSASFRGLKETVRVLVQAGAAVNHRDSHGRTALINAAQGSFWSYRRTGYIGLITWLLDQGADPGLMDNSRLTALAVARRYRRQNIVELLEKAGVRK